MKKLLLSSAMLFACASMAMAGVTVNVDDVTKCSIKNSNYQLVELVNGENTLEAGSYTLSYPGYDYKYKLNQVKLNGTDITAQASYGSYSFNEWGMGALKDGDVLDVTAGYGAATFAVTVNSSLEGVVTRADIFTFDGQYSYSNDSVANPLAFDAPAGYPAILFLNANYGIDSVTVNGVVTELDYNNRLEFTVVSASEVCVYAHAKSMAYARVDDASMVIVRNSSYENVTLASNQYTALAEGNYTISSAYSLNGYMLNNVLVNGKEQEPTYNAWTVTIGANDSLDIVAKYAVDSFQVNVTAPEHVVTKATTHGVEVANPLSFKAEAGFSTEFTLNTSDFKIDSVYVNNVKQNSTYGVSFYARKDANVQIWATPYGEIHATVILDDADNAFVLKGSYYQKDTIPNLVTGENAITISENIGQITIVPASGCVVDSVLKNGVAVIADWSGYMSPSIAEGDVIKVFTHKKERNNTLTVVLKDKAAANYSFSFATYEYEEMPLNEGVNTVKFAADESPFSITAYGNDLSSMVVYLNGQTLTPSYSYSSGGNYNDVDLNDGDYLEIYLLGGESQYSATGVALVKDVTNHDGKFLMNGKLYIMKNNRTYNLNGVVER